MKMNTMDTAPKDRAILLKVNISIFEAERFQFVVATYAEWDETGPYQRVWVTAPGECFEFDDNSIIGWYELPD